MKGVTGEMAIFMGETVCFTAFVTWVASGGGVLLHHGATGNFFRANRHFARDRRHNGCEQSDTINKVKYYSRQQGRR